MEKELFFKNSCVRDKTGELIPVYHGTSSEEFTVFVPDRNMDGNDQYGEGCTLPPRTTPPLDTLAGPAVM